MRELACTYLPALHYSQVQVSRILAIFHTLPSQYIIFQWFDDILVSGDVRLAKPDERIYRMMLERVGRPAGDCLFIDDTLGNIEAAQRMGFQVVHFQSAEQLEAELSRRQILM